MIMVYFSKTSCGIVVALSRFTLVVNNLSNSMTAKRKKEHVFVKVNKEGMLFGGLI